MLLASLSVAAQTPAPAPAPTEPAKVVYVEASNAQDAIGQAVVKLFVAAAGEVQVIPANPDVNAPDATVFHILTSTNGTDDNSDTLLFVALRHIQGSKALFYIGAYATNVKPGQEQEVEMNLASLAALTLGAADEEPDFQVTITPKATQPATPAPAPAPTKPTAFKGSKAQS